MPYLGDRYFTRDADQEIALAQYRLRGHACPATTTEGLTDHTSLWREVRFDSWDWYKRTADFRERNSSFPNN